MSFQKPSEIAACCSTVSSSAYNTVLPACVCSCVLYVLSDHCFWLIGNHPSYSLQKHKEIIHGVKNPLVLKAKVINKYEEKNWGFFVVKTFVPLEEDTIWSARAGLMHTELDTEWLSLHCIFSMHESCNLQREYLSIHSRNLCSFAETLKILGGLVISKICGNFRSC